MLESNNRIRKFNVYVDIEVDVLDVHEDNKAMQDLGGLMEQVGGPGTKLVYNGRIKIGEGSLQVQVKKGVDPQWDKAKNVIEDELKKRFNEKKVDFLKGIYVEWEKWKEGT